VLLGRNRAASACIDLSDGLGDGVARIADASGVGMTLDTAALPIEPAARAWWESRGQPAIERAVTGGDDYELLFTVRPRMRQRLGAVARHGGVAFTRIGVCTPGRTLVMRSPDGTDTPMPAGFTHFR
jgi:thiamine-monophosphate kinase